MPKEQLLSEFQLFAHGNDGIGSWLTEASHPVIFSRLETIEQEHLSKVQLNQLLGLGNEAPVSDDFFQYYWLEKPISHPYPVHKLAGFEPAFISSNNIISRDHLKWGMLRLYMDGLLYFGNIRTAYRQLRSLSKRELTAFFSMKHIDTEQIKKRGPALPLREIPKDDRYLISEMACKSYGDNVSAGGDLNKVLQESYQAHKALGTGKPTIRQLLSGEFSKGYENRQQEFEFSADDVLDESVDSKEELDQNYGKIAQKFQRSRAAALENTEYYLSMVNELDVYVATSMRSRQDFRNMATFCEKIFGDNKLKALQLRYFDPTMSAASGHEDKGLIECLMVKCAKVLVYCAGEKESWGKDAEAAMALSLGKPVIFYCDQEQRSRFYREVHPLSRLIEFATGVAVGVMVTDSTDDVATLLFRFFENQMEYRLEQVKSGFFRLREALTNSVGRLQTNDRMLSEAFWNHYHNRSGG